MEIDHPERAQCVAAEVHPPKTKLPKNVPPRTDMKYPTFMVITANILHKKSADDISMRCAFWKHLQQVAHACKDGIEYRPRQCLVNPPRLSLLAGSTEFQVRGVPPEVIAC
jgi:hypothetical protein